MSYARSALRARGDYRRMRGDPGLFGFLGKAAKGALGIVSRSGIPGISQAAGIARGLVGGGPGRQQGPGTFVGLRGPGGIQIGYERRSFQPENVVQDPQTGQLRTVKKRRRMNVANASALRRALRRQQGFVKLARRALKGSGYTIVTRGSRTPRGPRTIVESGSGSVITR